MKKSLSIILLFALIVMFGCSPSDEPVDSSVLNEASLKANTQSKSSQSKKPQPAIWADCEAFGTHGTNTAFKPTSGNFDELYNGANFKDGLGAISESKPGDQDFNGGRWHVNALKDGVDPNKYWNACSVEELDLSDFEATDVYFECPMLPIKG
jgi:hypothetical protein